MKALNIVAAVLLVAGVAHGDLKQDASGPENLVKNGTFADGPDIRTAKGVTHHAVGYTLDLPSGSTLLPGWTVSGSGMSISQGENGSRHSIWILGSGGRLSQLVPTQKGQSYILRVQWFSNGDPPAIKNLSIGIGSTWHAFTLSSEKGSETETLPFIADSSQTLIQFKSDVSGHGPFIDVVDLEPAGGKAGETNLLRHAYDSLDNSLAADYHYTQLDGTISDKISIQAPDGATSIRKEHHVQGVEMDKDKAKVHAWLQYSYYLEEGGQRHSWQVFHMTDDDWVKEGDVWKLHASTETGIRTLKDGQEVKAATP